MSRDDEWRPAASCRTDPYSDYINEVARTIGPCRLSTNDTAEWRLHIDGKHVIYATAISPIEARATAVAVSGGACRRVVQGASDPRRSGGSAALALAPVNRHA